mmetsp:Transcript_42075/g.112177  ORF Transcript_42075/g.112177 Transcript_42075/m.112177 type:complete len:411 (+) Transcript_42075:148-1380(+)
MAGGKAQKKKSKGPSLMSGQSEKDRAKLRVNQRKIGAEINDKRELIGDHTEGAMQEMRGKNNKAFEETRYTREAVLDAQNTAALVAATSRQVQALAMKQQKVTVDGMVKGLTDKKKRKFGWFEEEEHRMDWAELGKYAGRLVHAVPIAEFLCGSIERQEVKRARKERAVREKDDSEVVRPDDMVDKDEDVVESTEKRITNFTKVFFTKGCAKPGVTEFEEAQDQEQKPIDMFPFLIQPDSFTQTVENGGWWWVVVGQGLWSWHAHEWRQCGPRNATPRRASLICSSSHLSPHSTPVFDLSFFIKKGNASLELDENGMPTIRAVRSSANDNSGGQMPSSQLVMSLSMADVREIAATFNCTGEGGIEKRDDPAYNPNYLGTSAHTAKASSSSSGKEKASRKSSGKGKGKEKA